MESMITEKYKSIHFYYYNSTECTYSMVTCRLGCFRGSTCWYVLYFKSTMAASDSCPNPPIIMRDVLLIDTLQWS